MAAFQHQEDAFVDQLVALNNYCMRKIYLVIIFTFYSAFINKVLSQTKSFNYLIGKWVNTQYEMYSSKNDKKIIFNTSPQFILIDSIGRCTLILRFEQKADLGNLKRVKTFGNIKQYVYKKNYEMLLTEVESDRNLLIMSFANCPGSIIFKRYFNKDQ